VKYKIVEHANKAGKQYYRAFTKEAWWKTWAEVTSFNTNLQWPVPVDYETVDLAMAGINRSCWSEHEVIRGTL